jgi:hypothetical protein
VSKDQPDSPSLAECRPSSATRALTSAPMVRGSELMIPFSFWEFYFTHSLFSVQPTLGILFIKIYRTILQCLPQSLVVTRCLILSLTAQI